MFEVRERASGKRLTTFRDERVAREDVAARVDAAQGDRLLALDRFEVWVRDNDGSMRSLGGVDAHAHWVAFGLDRDAAETVTETRPATDDELAFLKRRQSSLGVETVIYFCAAAAIAFLSVFLTALAMGGGGIGAILGLIVALFIAGAGFAIAEGKRHDLKREARSAVITIKRGPFRAYSQPVTLSRSGRLRSGGGANADTYYASFADSTVQIDMAVGSRLERLGAVLDATVLLFPKTGQIVEVVGQGGKLLFRHEDFWHTSFRPSGGEAPVRKDTPTTS